MAATVCTPTSGVGASGIGAVTLGFVAISALAPIVAITSGVGALVALVSGVGALKPCAPTRTHELFAVNVPDAVHARLPKCKLGSLSSKPVSHENEHGTFSVSITGHAKFRALGGIAGRGPLQ